MGERRQRVELGLGPERDQHRAGGDDQVVERVRLEVGVAGASYIVDRASAAVVFALAAIALPLLAAWFARRIAVVFARERTVPAVE